MQSDNTTGDGAYSQRAIARFWAPLAAQWLMMALEGPFIAAIIARMGDTTLNLAAYGVALAFALLFESPVIMLMSASTALVEDARTYRRMRDFTLAVDLLATLVMVAVLLPPVFHLLMRTLLGLPADVVQRLHPALWLLLPWPAAIGYRRFLHGVLIRSGRTRLVAYGTVLRLAAMGGMATALYLVGGIPGAWVGAAALSTGVCVEAAAAQFMARGTVRALLGGMRFGPAVSTGASQLPPEDVGEVGAAVEAVSGSESVPLPVEAAELGYGEIARFYYPLALTSLIGLTVQPLLSFFMGRAPKPVESLAVFPVVHAATFLFRAPGLSFQEASIALLGRRFESFRPLVVFGGILSLATTGGLAILAFTPLAHLWFERVAGLPPHLSAVALPPARVAVLLPAMTVLISLQQAVLVKGRRTTPITRATAIEVAGIALLFLLFGWGFRFVGATAAFLALVGGRAASNGYLMPKMLRVRREGAA